MVAISFGHFFGHFNFPIFGKKVMQVANPNRAQFTRCASYAIPYTTYDASISTSTSTRNLRVNRCNASRLEKKLLPPSWNQISREKAVRARDCAKFLIFCACVCHLVLMLIARANILMCLCLCLLRTCKPSFSKNNNCTQQHFFQFSSPNTI